MTRSNTIGDLADATAGRASRPLLALASTLRRKGIVHPSGLLVSAAVEVAGDDTYAGTVLGAPGTHEAVVRFSRTVGLPGPVPDAFGIAMRMLDIDDNGGIQDLLVLTSAPGPATRQLILPARGHTDGFYSSITPFEINGHRRYIGARPHQRAARDRLPRLADVEGAVEARQLSFTLQIAGTTGPWRELGRLRLDTVVPASNDRPTFNPFNDGGGLIPVGALNGLRRRAYFGSQAGRTPEWVPDKSVNR